MSTAPYLHHQQVPLLLGQTATGKHARPNIKLLCWQPPAATQPGTKIPHVELRKVLPHTNHLPRKSRTEDGGPRPLHIL